MNKVLLNCGAWNEPYISNYLNYIYPNHLACLKQIENVDYDYYFYTFVNDLPKIQSVFNMETTEVLEPTYSDTNIVDYLSRNYGGDKILFQDRDIHGTKGMVSFPLIGVMRVDNELIYYAKGSLMTRGYNGTVAVPHVNGTPMVLQKEQMVVRNSAKKGFPNIKVMLMQGNEFNIEVMQTSIMQLAGAINGSVFILAGDVLYPRDSFSNVLNLANSNSSTVFFAFAYRVTSDIFPYLKDCDYSARNLVKLSLNHLHTRFTRHCVDSDIYDKYVVLTKGYIPSLLYWKCRDAGFIARTFHMTPLFFKNVPSSGLHGAADQGNYLAQSYPSDYIYIINDSDIAVNIDVETTPSTPLMPLGTNLNLSNSDFGMQLSYRPGENLTKAEIKEWARRWTYVTMREEAKHNIYIHSDDINTEEWEALKLKVNNTVKEIYGDLLG